MPNDTFGGTGVNVKFRASCKSSNIVYLITCRRCGLQYVGEKSQPLHVKINGHRWDISHRRTDVSHVAEHFNSSAHSVADMTVMVIEISPSRDPCLQKVKEGRLIRTLETSFPSGMNLRVDCLWNLGLRPPSVHPWVSSFPCHLHLVATSPSSDD